MTSREYHLAELGIARDPNDPRHILPPRLPVHGRVLDVGCGAGQTLIASEVSPLTTAVGVDTDLGSLVLGTQLTRRVRFVCTRGEALPFLNNSFSLVFSRVALPYMHVRTALLEMHRVLTPGGSFWAVLHSFHQALTTLRGDCAANTLKSAAFRLFVLASGIGLHVLGRQLSFPMPARRYESFQTKRAMTRLLVEAGFEGIVYPPGRFFVVEAHKRRDAAG